MRCQPPKVWYDSLRGNPLSTEIAKSGHADLSVNSTIQNNIEKAGSCQQPGTYSIPIRRAQQEFVPRG